MTGTAATKARAAAVRSVGNGPAGAVTTDMTGTGFKTGVTKSDGIRVEVDLDSSYNVIQGSLLTAARIRRAAQPRTVYGG